LGLQADRLQMVTSVDGIGRWPERIAQRHGWRQNVRVEQ
jgi:hypothetical protein